MKIQIVSDLHLEWVHHQFPDAPALPISSDADLLVLAGDIHAQDRALQAFEHVGIPVVYVMGNHESYGTSLFGLVDKLKANARDKGIHLLEMGELRKEGVRILGATLWTDYALHGVRDLSMERARRALADHRQIEGRQGLCFSPAQALERHQVTRTWLQAHLNAPFDGKTVVVTHHGVHPAGVADRFKGDSLTPAFFSDLRPLMDKVDLWVHGHTHSRVDLQEGRCRIVANPRGYPMNLRTASCVQDLVFENPQFDPLWVIEV